MKVKTLSDKKAKKITKVIFCLRETLENFEVGQELNIFWKEAKPKNVRSMATTINVEKGYVYSVTERNINDGCLVTRLR